MLHKAEVEKNPNHVTLNYFPSKLKNGHTKVSGLNYWNLQVFPNKEKGSLQIGLD
jgi:hypothetical protein